jgi:HSP90 family molecular chaperone
MHEKSIIQALYDSKAKNDSNSQDLANSLNILSKTVFGEVNRFVFELLQNADDAQRPAAEPHAEVEFRLLDNYMIFKHNGLHFSEDDAKGISRIGSRDSNKDKDSQKIGYKGIGFKSVFGSSDYVHIVSKNYSFCFDKNHVLWKDRKDYPWQVIPIWKMRPPRNHFAD